MEGSWDLLDLIVFGIVLAQSVSLRRLAPHERFDPSSPASSRIKMTNDSRKVKVKKEKRKWKWNRKTTSARVNQEAGERIYGFDFTSLRSVK